KIMLYIGGGLCHNLTVVKTRCVRGKKMSESEGRVFSQAVEDYTKAIYKLQNEEQVVSTTGLARKMGTTPAAATKMIKHLAENRLIDHTPYYGVRLTPAGERVAL